MDYFSERRSQFARIIHRTGLKGKSSPKNVLNGFAAIEDGTVEMVSTHWDEMNEVESSLMSHPSYYQTAGGFSHKLDC